MEPEKVAFIIRIIFILSFLLEFPETEQTLINVHDGDKESVTKNHTKITQY